MVSHRFATLASLPRWHDGHSSSQSEDMKYLICHMAS